MDFIDTNVLLYSVSSRAEDRGKMEVATALLAEHDVAFSAQVLQEFYWQATHESGKVRLAPADATDVVRSLLGERVQDVTPGLVIAAIATSQRFDIAYWDAAIIEAAKALGCGTIVTEDLNHGQDYGGVRVENPFRGL